jgi:hypothetical protein
MVLYMKDFKILHVAEMQGWNALAEFREMIPNRSTDTSVTTYN